MDYRQIPVRARFKFLLARRSHAKKKTILLVAILVSTVVVASLSWLFISPSNVLWLLLAFALVALPTALRIVTRIREYLRREEETRCPTCCSTAVEKTFERYQIIDRSTCGIKLKVSFNIGCFPL
jgi:hypothetical protein